MVKQIIPSANTQLTYPLYCCDFADPNRLVVAGGGGPGRNGVGNKIVREYPSPLKPYLAFLLCLFHLLLILFLFLLQFAWLSLEKKKMDKDRVGWLS